MRNGGYGSFAECARAHRHMRVLARFPIARVRMHGGRRADVIIDDHQISDSGFDALPVSRHGRRWLIDAD